MFSQLSQVTLRKNISSKGKHFAKDVRHTFTMVVLAKFPEPVSPRGLCFVPFVSDTGSR